MTAHPGFLRSRARRLRCMLAALAIALLLVLSPTGAVFAHANLIRSNPAAGQVVDRLPEEVELEFSESIDLRFARVRLVDVNGEPVADGEIRAAEGNPRVLLVRFDGAPEGVYSLAWTVRSAVDGHITRGTVGFSIGAGNRASLLPPAGDPLPAEELPGPLHVLIRWLGYLSVALAVGIPAFTLFVWRPAVQAEAVLASPQAAGWFLAFSRSWIFTGLAGAFIGTIGLAALQAAQTAGSGDPYWLRFLLLFDPHESGIIWARFGLLGLTAFLTRDLPPAGHRTARPWWEVFALGLALLLTYSLSGHSAALGAPLPVALDWLHMAAMAVWMGGLFVLAALLLQGRRGDMPAAGLVPRFSRLALLCVLVLAATGTYSALLHVRSPDALTGTRYGQALIIKLLLFGLLIGLGALNLLILSPRIAKASRPAQDWLSRTVRVELVAGGLVLVAAGFLLSISPAFDALQAQERLGSFQNWAEGEVQMKLAVAPTRVGENEFGVEIDDRRQGVEAAPPLVLFRFRPVGTFAEDATQAEAELDPGGRYAVRGSYITSAGAWQVEVILRRTGFNDVRHAFILDVQAPPEDPFELANPIPADPASIAEGQRVYQENCLPCHGESGRGDGPAGLTLNPRPANLWEHMVPGEHTDGELFGWISEGIPGSAMPPFEELLTEEERWHVINYIRSAYGPNDD